jgi:DNA-binding transcriptional ArsR family regulator
MAESEYSDGVSPTDGKPTSGWRVIAGSPAVVDLVDTLLDLPPHREFNKSELAELASVSRRSAQTHTETLLQAGLITEVEGTTPQRYRVDTDSEVTKHLKQLDAAVNRNGPAWE